MPDLRLPTDDEISQMVGGIPVTSYRPEDLPNFKPSIYQQYSQFEFSERLQAVRQRWMSFCPAGGNFGFAEDGISAHAGQRSANLSITWLNGSQKPTFFALLRPSEVINADVKLSNEAGLPVSHVRSGIPSQDRNFITTYHEIGHMDALQKGIKFATDFDDEMYAEVYGLQKYIDAGGDHKVVQNVIRGRALSGFLEQKPKYFLAPALASHFLEGNSKHPDYWDTWRSYAELRFRVADKISGSGVLENYTSSQIHDALHAWDEGRVGDIMDYDLRYAILDANDLVNAEHSIFNQEKNRVFDALDEIMENPNVDGFSKKNSHQILEAASLVTPTLVRNSTLLKYNKSGIIQKKQPSSDPQTSFTSTGNSSMPSVETKLAKGVGLGSIAVNIAKGDYASAALDVVMEGTDSELGEKIVEKTVKKAGGGFLKALGKGFKLFGKRIPVIGAVVTGGFVLYETGKHAVKGDWDKAGGSFVAGLAETAGNFVGFGVGDAAREVTRQGLIEVGGKRFAAVDKSGLRTLAEDAYDIVNENIFENKPNFTQTEQKPKANIKIKDNFNDALLSPISLKIKPSSALSSVFLASREGKIPLHFQRKGLFATQFNHTVSLPQQTYNFRKTLGWNNTFS